MKVWNKPIRIQKHWKGWQSIGEPICAKWGITSWMVGRCEYPWSPWLQLSLGTFTIQIKYYVLVSVGIIGAFLLGILV